jgi:hypothetical protein|tara:strand:- start:11 stop:265 length:255 start_codon:yes stop_codon:yes gene_type:complete
MAELAKEPWIHRLCIDFGTQADMLSWFKESIEDGTLPEDAALSVVIESDGVRFWQLEESDGDVSYDDLESLIDALSEMTGGMIN